MAVLLDVEDVVVKFGGVTAIDGATLQVNEGQIVGLIGPNGAGKTTLLNCISGTCRPVRGNVAFAGSSLIGKKPEKIAAVGIGRTFQVVQPFAGMNVRENVAIGALFGKKREPRSVRAALNMAERRLYDVGLPDMGDSAVEQLTMGDRKRLELARALAMDPLLLLLDEVMAGLNHAEIEGMMELIKSLNKNNVAILMIEHVMKAIMGTCHTVVVLRNGKIIANGVPEDIVKNDEVISAYLGDRWLEPRTQSGVNDSTHSEER